MVRTRSVVLIGVVCLAALPDAEADMVTLRDATPLTVRLRETLRSGKQKRGETFDVEAAESIRGQGGAVAIEAGAQGRGSVTMSKKSGMLGKAGKLEFSIDYVEAVDGTRVPTRALLWKSGKSQKGWGVWGALLLAWPLAFVKGHNVTVQEGFELTVYVDGDQQIELPKPEGADTLTISPGQQEASAVQALDIGQPVAFTTGGKRALVAFSVHNPNEKLGLLNAHVDVSGFDGEGDLMASNSTPVVGDPRHTLFSLAPEQSRFCVKEVSLFGSADQYFVHVSESFVPWDDGQAPDVQVLSLTWADSKHVEGTVANRSGHAALVEVAAVGRQGETVKACGLCIVKDVAPDEQTTFRIEMVGEPSEDLDVSCTASGTRTDKKGSESEPH